jgi:hypothetical protein
MGRRQAQIQEQAPTLNSLCKKLQARPFLQRQPALAFIVDILTVMEEL